MSINVTYRLERKVTKNFQGWIIWQCYEGVEEEYYSTSSYQDAREMLRDLSV